MRRWRGSRSVRAGVSVDARAGTSRSVVDVVALVVYPALPRLVGG